MSAFHDAATPDDVPLRHQGEPIDDELDSTDEPEDVGEDDENHQSN